ncbi:MAG: GxxExxY protein [bacterium]
MTIPTDLGRTHDLIEKTTTGQIIGAFYAVYNELGSGLLESAYAGALEVEFTERGIEHIREFPLAVYYHGRVVATYRSDFLVRRRVMVEVKSARVITDGDRQQLLHYLRATRTQVGLLLHFGPQARFYRMVNGGQ